MISPMDESDAASSPARKPPEPAPAPPRKECYSGEDRSALLFMLEDLEAGRRKIEQAHREWMAALDAVNTPIFLHDREFRILRCNMAYQQCAGVPFKNIIGRPYYEIFPKNHAPMPCCLRAMEKAEEEEEEEEVAIGEAIYRLRALSLRDEQGAYLFSVHILEDITARKRTEEELRLKAQLLDGVNDSVFVHDLGGKFIYLNEAAWRSRGYTRDELMSMSLLQLDTPEYGKTINIRTRELMEKGYSTFESAHLRKDGSVMPIEVSARLIESGGRKLILATTRDITERKQAEQALRESEKLYRSLFENMLNGFAYCRMIFEQDQPQDYIFIGVNAAFEVLTGLKDVAGKKVSEVIPGIRQTDPGLFDALGRVALSGKSERFEIYLDSMQQWFWLSVYSPAKYYFVAVFDVITERKKAEEALKKSEALLSEMSRMAKMGGWEFEPQTGQGTWTEEVARIHDMGPEEQTSMEIGLGFYQGEYKQKIEAAIRAAIADGTPYDLELEMLTAKGNHKWVRSIAQPVRVGGKTVRVAGSFQDITGLKQAEIAVQHANRALATLSAVNRTLVRAASEDELLQVICEAIVQQRGYLLAWVGYKQHDENRSIRIMAHAGRDEGYLDAAQITWAETERGMGASGRAIRSGKTQLCQDIANTPHYSPWREAALKRGYAASIALPLGNGEVFGILNVYAAEVNAFTPNEIDLLEEMAGDLAFGVRSLHVRRERDLAMEQNRQHLAQLKDSLEDTVRAMAGLAMSIARQMGLPDEQVHAIHLAGMVHDLGKIQVPAEILSKPGKITALEFGLIKIHPQAGYDILKGINFPRPIAQMVWQHHERLDGSGYPQGLKGEAILLEARILAVADVVEAISAHRPYRPGLGIEVALAEIGKGRGVHYDPQAVDACIKLFKEENFVFDSA